MLICLVQGAITGLKLKLWCHKILQFKSDLGWEQRNAHCQLMVWKQTVDLIVLPNVTEKKVNFRLEGGLKL